MSNVIRVFAAIYALVFLYILVQALLSLFGVHVNPVTNPAM